MKNIKNLPAKIILFVAVIIIAALAIWLALGQKTPAVSTTASGKLQVTASFYPLYYFASEIGGDKAEVSNITPPGGEPHDYEPTAQDIVQIENSRLLILNGFGLEAWGSDIAKNVDPAKTLLVTASDGIISRQLTEEGQTMIDPHVWLSPELAKTIVDNIAAGFVKADPANAPYYQNNAAQLKDKLDRLDAAYRAGLADCQLKDIVTSHAAFGYLAAAYGLNQIAIAGLSPDAEPSPEQLADIVKQARTDKIKYIFFESLVSPKLAQTIATEINAQTLVFNPLEGLTKDEIAQGQDYFTEMRNNLTNLRTALQCAK
ncbi:MAG TPA: zinc ABC transporter substrate-binding protein [Candidatus Nanoarchaeia archaeon]|nr:zinc ABC transporter substrate-binding protein [Candidatus Nanoarchaeia archaeon]